MLSKLKWTFTLLSASLTGLVLLVACFFAFFSAKSSLESAYKDAFETQSQTLSIMLAGSNRINHSQIYRMEKENGMLIFLFDNGHPVRIGNGNETKHRESLYIAAINSLSNTDIGFVGNPEKRYDEPVNLSGNFVYDNTGYLTKFISAPTRPQQWYSFVLVMPDSTQSKEVTNLKVIYTGIFLAGLLFLTLISWSLAKRSVKPVEDAQQKKKEFIASASHELKSPLTIIISSVDMMERDKTKVDSDLQNIRAEAKRMSGLVDDLLLLAGADTGKWKIKKSLVNVDDVLVSAYERYIPVAGKKHQTLTLALPENPLPEILADEERLIQVLAILLSNAASYSPENSKIELTAHTGKKQVILSVIDHGSGIREQDKEHLFDSFYRVERSHSDKSHFGLGLAIAKELMQLHNGEISVTDTPGGGATFNIILPTQ